MSTPTSVCAGLLLAIFLLAPAGAQESRPSATLGEILATARSSGDLKEGTRREFWKGKNPNVAIVEHELKVTKEGLSSVFTEHGTNGAFVRSTYRLDLKGVVQEVTLERGTRDSYPEATETTRHLREGKELVEQVKEGEPAGQRRKLPENATPMSVATFLLPSLSQHLPARLEFVPLFEDQIHPQTMVLTYEATKSGGRAAIEMQGAAAVTVEIDAKGRVLHLLAPSGNTIKPVPTSEAEGILAKLRPA